MSLSSEAMTRWSAGVYLVDFSCVSVGMIEGIESSVHEEGKEAT